MYFLAQSDQIFNLTGLIATILSVIFGIAAFYNSRTRKKHQRELELAQKQENRMHFRPAKSTPPAARSSLPNRSVPPHQSSSVHGSDRPTSTAPKAAPVAKSFQDTDIPSVQPKEKPDPEPVKESAPLFRKVKPSGSADLDTDLDKHDKENYVWE